MYSRLLTELEVSQQVCSGKWKAEAMDFKYPFHRSFLICSAERNFQQLLWAFWVFWRMFGLLPVKFLPQFEYIFRFKEGLSLHILFTSGFKLQRSVLNDDEVYFWPKKKFLYPRKKLRKFYFFYLVPKVLFMAYKISKATGCKTMRVVFYMKVSWLKYRGLHCIFCRICSVAVLCLHFYIFTDILQTFWHKILHILMKVCVKQLHTVRNCKRYHVGM
jgi:hypothetical protein